MKVNAEIYASIDSSKLYELLEKNSELEKFTGQEFDRIMDDQSDEGCSSCSDGGCSGCDKEKTMDETAYLACALISIFNYYLPGSVKDAVKIDSSTYIE